MVRSTSSNFADFAFVRRTRTQGGNTGRVRGERSSRCAQEDGTGRGRTMDEEVRGSAGELDSGTAGRLRLRGQWATMGEELRAGKDNGRRWTRSYGPTGTMDDGGQSASKS
jgi:hypothetical protein